MAERRALHFVFKVANRNETIAFYRDLLGMKILRHEEFEEGCKASCNGPYDGKWSKTMVGYGAEDENFVVELTYNYSVGAYHLGNDFISMNVKSTASLDRAESNPERWNLQTDSNGQKFVLAPGGYKFILEKSEAGDILSKVTLASSDLEKSVNYWSDLLQMKILERSDANVLMSFADDQANLELVQTSEINHATGFGRIAFSIPTSQLEDLQKSVEAASGTILARLVSLDTPGKATVSVVILADPDGHEICFVGDEAFRELSKVDQNAEHLLNEAMAKDKSQEWFNKKGKRKAVV